MIVEPRFQWANPFKHGRSAVQTSSGKIGFIDRSGKLVVEQAFDAVLIHVFYPRYYGFKGELAGGVIKDRRGRNQFAWIDKEGEIIWGPKGQVPSQLIREIGNE